MMPGCSSLALLLVAAQPVDVAILDFVVAGADDASLVAPMTGKLADIVGARSDVEVIAPDHIRAVVEVEESKQRLGCNEESCLKEVAEALGAELLIQGRLARIEGGFTLSLVAVRTGEVKPVNQVSMTWGGREIALLELLEPLVDLLLLPAGERATGALSIVGAPGDGLVFVDDAPIGTTDSAPVRLPIGAHRVLVTADGYLPVEQWTIIKRDRGTSLSLAMEPAPRAPLYSTWWFWTLAGVAVAGTILGVAVVGRGTSDRAATAPTGVNVLIDSDTVFGGQ
ncbi:MAG: hypothetical protein H6729_05160 [Deltaproteobacteria bacterium]|nr:hypothetical protein [Deltaproteobacteria bacterium]